MRRKPGELIPIERSIIEAASQLRQEGFEEFHGIQIANKIKDREGARLLTAYGTLYRALGRLQERGILQSRWEELLPEDGNRPRHRYYRLIGETETIASQNPTPVHERTAYKILGLGESRA
jgi:PadR family transcriptional regulator PadR